MIKYEKYYNLREAKGVKDADVVKATGVAKSTFSAWKRGDYTPKQEKIKLVADYFNVPMSYFYSDDEESANVYENAKVQEIAEEILDRKGLQTLFDLAKDASEEDIQFVVDMLERFKGED